MADTVAIKVERVSKNFVLPHEKVTSVKSAFTSMLNPNRSKEVQRALKNVSFEIQEGEFFGIVGRNGSGKSTMLKILAGIYQPTKGAVHTRGKLVPFIELGVGFNPELTGRENVYLNGAMLGFSRKEVAAMYDDIVAFAELERFMDQKLKNYSSGMQVRLAFSMATRSEADILLVDEVLAVGDADFQRKCFEYFKTLKRDKKTVVFVSHDMEAVRQYCTRAALLKDSQLEMVGTADVVATAYSQMFVSNMEQTTKDTPKWGDGSVDVADVHMRSDGKHITLSFTIEAKRAVQNILYGFSLKDSAGVRVIATNSQLNNDPECTLAAGESRTITYTFADVLNDGEYTVDIAVEDDTATTIMCWWENATGLSIKKLHRLPSLLNYPIELHEKN